MEQRNITPHTAYLPFSRLLFQRLLGRVSAEGRADDADTAIIERRMKTFKEKTRPVLPVGTMIAIEPIATMGFPEVFTADDHWTVSTVDRSFACHFEHSVLLTEAGYEIVA